MDYSEGEKATARAIRDSLRDLERLAETEHFDLLGYLLRLAIDVADEITGDLRPVGPRTTDLGKRE